MTHITRRLIAKNRDQLWNPAIGNRIWATSLPFYIETRSSPNVCACACACGSVLLRRRGITHPHLACIVWSCMLGTSGLWMTSCLQVMLRHIQLHEKNVCLKQFRGWQHWGRSLLFSTALFAADLFVLTLSIFRCVCRSSLLICSVCLSFIVALTTLSHYCASV